MYLQTMTIKEIMARGIVIAKQAEDLTKQTPTPVDELQSLSDEWRGYCSEFLALVDKVPAEERMNLQDFFCDVMTMVDLPIIWATKGKRKKAAS